MIQLDELRALADKLDKTSLELKFKSMSESDVAGTATMGEAIGYKRASLELWKFINKQSLKQLN